LKVNFSNRWRNIVTKKVCQKSILGDALGLKYEGTPKHIFVLFWLKCVVVYYLLFLIVFSCILFPFPQVLLTYKFFFRVSESKKAVISRILIGLNQIWIHLRSVATGKNGFTLMQWQFKKILVLKQTIGKILNRLAAHI
jgi:hypothetical protein